ACRQSDLCRTDAGADRVRQVAAPELRCAEVADDLVEENLARLADECPARVDTPQEVGRLDGFGLRLHVDQGGGRVRVCLRRFGLAQGADDRRVARRRPAGHPGLHAGRHAGIACVIDETPLLVIDPDDVGGVGQVDVAVSVTAWPWPAKVLLEAIVLSSHPTLTRFDAIELALSGSDAVGGVTYATKWWTPELAL